MKPKQPESRTGRMREFLRAHGTVKTLDAAKALDITPRKASKALDKLTEVKEARRCGKGEFEWAGDRPDHVYCPKQYRIWRILCVRTKMGKSSSAKYIYEMCGGEVSKKLVSSYIAHLVLNAAAVEADPEIIRGKRVSRYMTHPDKVNDENPPVMRRAKQTSFKADALSKIRKDVSMLQSLSFAAKPDFNAIRFHAEKVLIEAVSVKIANGLRQTVKKTGGKEALCSIQAS